MELINPLRYPLMNQLSVDGTDQPSAKPFDEPVVNCTKLNNEVLRNDIPNGERIFIWHVVDFSF